MLHFKHLFANILTPHIPEYTLEDIITMIEIPPQGLGADLAFPCFGLAKIHQKSPVQVSNELKEKIDSIRFWTLTIKWPYINILFDPIVVINEFNAYQLPSHSLSVLIESPSPNTNKPLHLGHVRNMVLGNVLSRSLQYQWYTVTKVEVVNDRGIHICKSMLAYQLWGDGAEPNKKSDHYVGDRYVRYANEVQNDPSLDEQAQAMLRAREQGDKEVHALRKKMNTRALEWMRETYTRYGTHIDDATYESDVYHNGKSIAEQWLQDGIFVRDPKGNIAFPVPINDEETSYFVVLRSDGTTLYATQDLALVDERFKRYHMDKMVYIVGNEQDDYFKTLFRCFKALNYPFASQCHHLSYGMIELPNGKMKSRTGNVVDADNLIEELHTQSFQEIKKRFPDLDEHIAHERAEKIALWAINFFMIKIDAMKGFVFDPAQSLSFEGETGPYVQYTYARIASLIQKAHESLWTQENDRSLLTNLEEINTIKEILFHLSKQGEIIDKTNTEYKPHLLARYTLDLCQLINSFYQKYHILTTQDKQISANRVRILEKAQQSLGEMMDLLWVPRIDSM